MVKTMHSFHSSHVQETIHTMQVSSYNKYCLYFSLFLSRTHLLPLTSICRIHHEQAYAQQVSVAWAYDTMAGQPGRTITRRAQPGVRQHGKRGLGRQRRSEHGLDGRRRGLHSLDRQRGSECGRRGWTDGAAASAARRTARVLWMAVLPAPLDGWQRGERRPTPMRRARPTRTVRTAKLVVRPRRYGERSLRGWRSGQRGLGGRRCGEHGEVPSWTPLCRNH